MCGGLARIFAGKKVGSIEALGLHWSVADVPVSTYHAPCKVPPSNHGYGSEALSRVSQEVVQARRGEPLSVSRALSLSTVVINVVFEECLFHGHFCLLKPFLLQV